MRTTEKIKKETIATVGVVEVPSLGITKIKKTLAE
jgi:hypothetical protein